MCFSNEQLDSYVENTAHEKLRKEIEEHLPKCKTCFKDVKERLIFKRLLSLNLGTPGGPHPDFEDIENFYHNKLGEEKEAEIVNHLLYCDDCRESLEIVRTKQMIEQGEMPGYEKAPEKLPPKLDVHFVKNRVKEIASGVVQKRFADKQGFFTKLWDKLSAMPEMVLPRTPELVGALGISSLEEDTPESDIFKIITTLEDAEKKIDEKDDSKKAMRKIRRSAKKNSVKSELIDDLIQFAKPHY
jgi:hypothetical protein